MFGVLISKSHACRKFLFFFERRIDTLKKHFVITFLLMIFILIVHCAKEKKTNVKKNVSIRPLTKETYDVLVYLVKNHGNCDIAVKERKPFQKNAIVKFWRKRQSGEGFVLGKSVI